MKMIAFLLSIVLLVSSCALNSGPRKNEFSVDRGAGNELIVTLPQPHPSSFSIRDPNGVWFVIQNAKENIFLLSQRKFDRAKKLTIDPYRLSGTTSTDGEVSQEPVFSVSGEYLFYFADHLTEKSQNTYTLSSLYMFRR